MNPQDIWRHHYKDASAQGATSPPPDSPPTRPLMALSQYRVDVAHPAYIYRVQFYCYNAPSRVAIQGHYNQERDSVGAPPMELWPTNSESARAWVQWVIDGGFCDLLIMPDPSILAEYETPEAFKAYTRVLDMIGVKYDPSHFEAHMKIGKSPKHPRKDPPTG